MVCSEKHYNYTVPIKKRLAFPFRPVASKRKTTAFRSRSFQFIYVTFRLIPFHTHVCFSEERTTILPVSLGEAAQRSPVSLAEAPSEAAQRSPVSLGEAHSALQSLSAKQPSALQSLSAKQPSARGRRCVKFTVVAEQSELCIVARR